MGQRVKDLGLLLKESRKLQILALVIVVGLVLFFPKSHSEVKELKVLVETCKDQNVELTEKVDQYDANSAKILKALIGRLADLEKRIEHLESR